MTHTILVVDDDADMADLLGDHLRAEGYEVVTATSGVDALDALARSHPDVVLTDIRMPGMDGLEMCRRVREQRPDVPVVVLTGFGDMATAIDAMRAGAYDFLSKPIEMEAVTWTIARAAAHRTLTREVRRLRRSASSPSSHGIIGTSTVMRHTLDLLQRAARSDVPVLVTGETGTGKELAARAIHAMSSRSRHPFVAVNCAALPDALIESELFGHKTGAFTDARTDRRGLFVEAGEGTLFLDEITELPVAVQPKLLRVLQERVVRPLGDSREYPVRCRVITATNRDPREAVTQGILREDLYYRIAVLTLEMPPLRARAGDILQIAQHFLERAADRMGRPVQGLTTPAARALLAYDWPGNVRELENTIERAVALTDHDRLLLEDLPEPIRRPERRGIKEPDPDDVLRPLDAVINEHIRRVLDAVDGNKSAAAEILGVDRRTLYRRLERLEGGR